MYPVDLKAMQVAKAWKYFIFLSENQPGYACAEPLKLNLTFTSMDIMTTPPTFSIFFLGMGNCLGLDFVTAVSCKPHMLGTCSKSPVGVGNGIPS